jgi:molybdopterin-guanine dinucleotide biosynthesis protein A
MHWDSAVIFAGGKSSRMGRDKALIPFGGFDTLSQYQYARLGRWFEHLYISAKSDKFPFEAKVVQDKYTSSSPMVALVSSLENIDADELFVISVDMPYVDRELIARIHQAYNDGGDAEIVIASSANGNEPLCGIYSRGILPRAVSLVEAGRHRMQDLLNVCQTKAIKCDRESIFANLNTRQDYNKYNGAENVAH